MTKGKQGLTACVIGVVGLWVFFAAIAQAGANAENKIAIHVVPHGLSCKSLPTFAECSQIATTDSSTGDIDVVPVFFGLTQYTVVEFGLTWPVGWGSCDYVTCVPTMNIGGITNSGDGIASAWTTCQTGWSVSHGYGWLNATGAGAVSIVPNPATGDYGVVDCAAEPGPNYDRPETTFSAGVGGAAGDDPCAEPQQYRGGGGERDLGNFDWSAARALQPVWVLRVEGDRAAVAASRAGGFEDSSGRPFPIGIVPLSSTTPMFRDVGGNLAGGVSKSALVRVDQRGQISDTRVTWTDMSEFRNGGHVVGGSLASGMFVVANQDEAEIRAPGGIVVSKIPYHVRYACFYDVAQRILIVGEQALEAGSSGQPLSKIAIFDYSGAPIYDGSWGDCRYDNPRANWNASGFFVKLSGCGTCGEYLLKTGPREMTDLRDLPGGHLASSESSDHVLMYFKSNLGVYAVPSTTHPALLWRTTFSDRVLDAAVSDGAGYVAYGLGRRIPEYAEVYVVSGGDGTPLAKLVSGTADKIRGPFTFIGDYLFTGCTFGAIGPSRDTDVVCVFDLSVLRR